MGKKHRRLEIITNFNCTGIYKRFTIVYKRWKWIMPVEKIWRCASPIHVIRVVLLKASWDKKVLLRGHKRHTARRVSSTPSAILSRGGGGAYAIPGQGYPNPDLAGVLPPSWSGRGTRPPPPPGVDWQTGTITLPHPSDAGGNESFIVCSIRVHTPFLTLDTVLDEEVAGAEAGVPDCDCPVMFATKPSRSFLRLASRSRMLLWRLFKAWMSLHVSDMINCKIFLPKLKSI